MATKDTKKKAAKPADKKTAAKKTTAKKSTAKKTTTKKAPVKKAVVKKPAVKEAPAKSVAKPKAEKVTKTMPKVAPKRKVVSKGNDPVAHGVGRRKSSVARVWLRRGTGKMIINGREYKTYFDTEVTRKAATIPFVTIPNASSYDVEANVTGGGLWSQADAVKLGFARALLQSDESLKPILRQHGLLTVDARLKERKKYGQRGARRRFQFVKR